MLRFKFWLWKTVLMAWMGNDASAIGKITPSNLIIYKWRSLLTKWKYMQALAFINYYTLSLTKNRNLLANVNKYTVYKNSDIFLKRNITLPYKSEFPRNYNEDTDWKYISNKNMLLFSIISGKGRNWFIYHFPEILSIRQIKFITYLTVSVSKYVPPCR